MTAAADVKVIALFSNKAMLQIDGEQKIVSNGETFKGVTLMSATGRRAIVELEGQTVELKLNQSIAGNFKKPERSKMKIFPDSLGMYVVNGKINGQNTRFLVDTGATFVTISGAKAASLKIDLSNAQRTTAQTASAIVNVFQIKLDSVSVGGIELKQVETMVIPGNQPFDVLLGNSFLQHTRINKAGSVLEIEKRF
ncbi:MAG: retropepsin-like aspartic protease [Pseudomonadota bacterium]